MNDDANRISELVHFESTRFGPLSVSSDRIITFPSGLIGFPRPNKFVLIDHKHPFSWLHGVDEPSIAFVVIDGFEVGYNYDLTLPFSQPECDFKETDEFAILVVVTVRGDPSATTANLKAPLFVNIRNLRGAQVIFDSPDLSTRVPLCDIPGFSPTPEKSQPEDSSSETTLNRGESESQKS
jgi:flagellar assembly factor FliW